MTFTDLLQNPDFRAALNDYEWHAAQDHPAAEDIWEYIKREFDYEL